jgi:hypothetical protein
MTTNVPQDVIDQVLEPKFIKWMHDYFCSDEGTITRKTYERMFDSYKAGCQNDELRDQRAGGEAVAWDAEAFARLDQIDSNKWVVHKPEGAPYAGIRTKDGRTIAGTSSGLSDEHAQEICANQQNREYIKVLLKKITDLQRQIESHPPQPTLDFAAVMMEAAEICLAEQVDYEATHDPEDLAYNSALDHAATAIRAAIPADAEAALREVCMKVATAVRMQALSGPIECNEIEAIVLASLGGIRLTKRAAAEIGKQKE